MSSTPFAFQRHQQHSINFRSAVSPPALRSDRSLLTDSPNDRLSSASTSRFPNMIHSTIYTPTQKGVHPVPRHPVAKSALWIRVSVCFQLAKKMCPEKRTNPF